MTCSDRCRCRVTQIAGTRGPEIEPRVSVLGDLPGQLLVDVEPLEQHQELARLAVDVGAPVPGLDGRIDRLVPRLVDPAVPLLLRLSVRLHLGDLMPAR